MASEERVQRHVQELLQQIVRHLDDEEYLGEPRREEDRIVIPIKQSGSRAIDVSDAASMRALLTAWMD